MNDISNLSDTIVPKSDQLNTDDLVTGAITVTILDVRRYASKDQPIGLFTEGRQPYKPCLSMRRVLMEIWGGDGRKWIGRSLTLYRDDSVSYGKSKNCGGIRISHLSDIDRPVKIMVTTRRAFKEEKTFLPLVVEVVDHTQVINQFNAEQDQAKRDSLWAGYSAQQQAAIQNSINGVK